MFILIDLWVSCALHTLHTSKVVVYQGLKTGGALLKMFLIHLGTSGLILNRMEEAQGDKAKPIKFLKAYAWTWHSISTNVQLAKANQMAKPS